MKYLWLKTFTEETSAAIDRLKADCLMQDGRLPLLNLPEQMEVCDGCLTAVSEDSGIRGILTCLYGENTVEVCILVHPEFRGRGIGTELLHRLILSTGKIPVFPVAADDANAMAFLSYIGKREVCRETLEVLTRETYSDEKTGLSPCGKKRLRVTCKVRPTPDGVVDDTSGRAARPGQSTSDGDTDVTSDRTGHAARPGQSALDGGADVTSGRAGHAACSGQPIPDGVADVTLDRQMCYTLYLSAIPIGRCMVTGGCISEVWIRSIFRRRGYGSFLLRTVIRHQFSLGRKKLMLHVTSLNTAACALYRKYGFEVTEEIVYYS